MDKKVFLAVALCAAIFLIWQNVYLKPYQEQQARLREQATAQQQTTAQPPAPTGTPVSPGSPVVGGPKATLEAGPKVVSIGDQQFKASISTVGGTVQSFEIPDYRGHKTDDLTLLIGGPGQAELTTPSPDWAFITSAKYAVQATAADKLVLAYDDANVSIQRTYATQPKLYSIDQDIAIKFKKQPPAFLFVGVQARKDIPKAKQENERREVWFFKAGGHEKWGIGDVDADKIREDLGQGIWAGLSSRYFLNALVDQSNANPQFQARYLANGDVGASLIYKVTGPEAKISVREYYGPKDVSILKEAGKNLDGAVDFGWFTVIAYPMLQALKWFYKYVHNYGVAIILLTILVKLITYPLTLKSMKSMKDMQRIQPQLAALREKYKDNKEQLNKEMLTLMRANGYNPMGGCLPIFIQMPIFIALYNVLYGAIDLVNEPFFGWIHDLSLKDPYYVTPVLLALMMFLQQKLTPQTATDPAQQRMMMMMPVIFGFMMLWLPSGLTLYMLVNSVVSILQQLWMNRTLGIGKPATA